jgi:uncharacterized membrane protein YhaH (DUF805 family)
MAHDPDIAEPASAAPPARPESRAAKTTAGLSQALAVLSPFAGRIAQRPFWLAAAALYAAVLLSQLLTLPGVMARIGAWPFVIVQAALLWVWFTLHAQRLRDAGHGIAAAAGVAAIGALAMLLLLVAAAFYFDPFGAVSGEEARAMPGMLVAAVLTYLFQALVALPGSGSAGVLLMLLVLTACASVPLAVAFSIWAGTRASMAAVPPATA